MGICRTRTAVLFLSTALLLFAVSTVDLAFGRTSRPPREMQDNNNSNDDGQGSGSSSEDSYIIYVYGTLPTGGNGWGSASGPSTSSLINTAPNTNGVGRGSVTNPSSQAEVEGENTYGVTSEEATSVCEGLARGQSSIQRMISVLSPMARLSSSDSTVAQALSDLQTANRNYTNTRNLLHCSQTPVPVPTNSQLRETCQGLDQAEDAINNSWPEGYFEDLHTEAINGVAAMKRDLSCAAVGS